jgi:KTSC domain
MEPQPESYEDIDELPADLTTGPPHRRQQRRIPCWKLHHNTPAIGIQRRILSILSDTPTIVHGVMTWHPSTSDAIEAYAYDAPTETLHLRFRDGSTTYDYPCTTPLFENFLRAPSKGRFVTEILKPYAQFRGTSPRPQRSGR